MKSPLLEASRIRSHADARTLEGGLIRQRLVILGDSDTLSSEDQLREAGLLNKNCGRILDRWKGDPKFGEIKAQKERTVLMPKG